MRPEHAIVRHWQLVMPAFTFSRLAGTAPPAAPPEPVGKKPGPRIVWQETLRQVCRWLCPWARLQHYWRRWSAAPPPPELAALLDHVARSRPHGAPT